ncbi:hypothetical protein B0H17DRAFT_1210406 [Mycena rosella]|uniref:Uncharacterized protein n=1 Tax=Mycena rosella TaxID=1033263 RepID=A0AAD7CWZ8_MYCRO|nr:hypothetical protein B0H17DRAFT_1210406 [Mycena rosella]
MRPRPGPSLSISVCTFRSRVETPPSVKNEIPRIFSIHIIPSCVGSRSSSVFCPKSSIRTSRATTDTDIDAYRHNRLPHSREAQSQSEDRTRCILFFHQRTCTRVGNPTLALAPIEAPRRVTFHALTSRIKQAALRGQRCFYALPYSRLLLPRRRMGSASGLFAVRSMYSADIVCSCVLAVHRNPGNASTGAASSASPATRPPEALTSTSVHVENDNDSKRETRAERTSIDHRRSLSCPVLNRLLLTSRAAYGPYGSSIALGEIESRVCMVSAAWSSPRLRKPDSPHIYLSLPKYQSPSRLIERARKSNAFGCQALSTSEFNGRAIAGACVPP